MFDFEVKLARGQKEVEGALGLRHEVFRLEMGAGQGGEELETDVYDKFCDHLIVIDKTVEKIVGTYRLLLGSKADKDVGFYSERIFDISNIKKLMRECEIMELGRSCIHKDYRTGSVINLLWNGIARHIQDYNVRYLFGSVRLLTSDPQEVSKTFKFIKERYYAEDQFRVYPREKNKFSGLNERIRPQNYREAFRHLPPLVKGYLRVGVQVCGKPAYNPDLDSVVIFILLDAQKMTSSYRHHYLQ